MGVDQGAKPIQKNRSESIVLLHEHRTQLIGQIDGQRRLQMHLHRMSQRPIIVSFLQENFQEFHREIQNENKLFLRNVLDQTKILLEQFFVALREENLQAMLQIDATEIFATPIEDFSLVQRGIFVEQIAQLTDRFVVGTIDDLRTQTSTELTHSNGNDLLAQLEGGESKSKRDETKRNE